MAYFCYVSCDLKTLIFEQLNYRILLIDRFPVSPQLIKTRFMVELTHSFFEVG